MYYVYVLIDPRNNQPFYVGKGKGKRVEAHYYNWASDRMDNPYKSKKIEKLKKLGYQPKYEIVFEHTDVKLVYEEEKRLIAKWGRHRYDKGGILTNIRLGGEGSPEACRPVKQYNLFGEYIQTFSSCLAAIKSCGKENSSPIIGCCRKKPSHKSAFSYFWTYAEEELDLEWCFGGKKKPVYQWDLEGNFINRYINVNRAALHFQKLLSYTEILKRAKKGGSCQNFQWTFTNCSPGVYVKNVKPNPRSVEVYQWSINGELIRKHSSFYQANLFLGLEGKNVKINRDGIKKGKVVHDFRWTLKKDIHKDYFFPELPNPPQPRASLASSILSVKESSVS
jgi:hypothetical protein